MGTFLTEFRQAEFYGPARRVFEVLDTPSEVQNELGAIVPGPLAGGIVFERVGFGYAPQARVLEEVSFEAAPRPGHRYFRDDWKRAKVRC